LWAALQPWVADGGWRSSWRLFAGASVWSTSELQHDGRSSSFVHGISAGRQRRLRGCAVCSER
ncbi:unnamed protein product, partial [Amoebophrya sp. A120]